MHKLRLNEAVRRPKQRTTTTTKDGIRTTDKLNRDFSACAPNHVWIADFTSVATRTGYSYLTFLIDAYSHTLVG